MITINSPERFLEIQFQAWSHNNKKQQGFRAGQVIAISRNPGCDVELVAGILAEKLGLTVYDSEIVEAIARDASVSERMVATLEDNCRSELDEWLDAFNLDPVLSNDQYLLSLRKVLFTIATHGNAIILGRGANFLLPPDKRTLGLYLVAPLEMRVSTVMKTLDLSREKALKHIAHMELEQHLWVKKFGCADVTSATNYHLIINTALVTPEAIVQIVTAMLHNRPDHNNAK